ncbi:MAG: hypothetical protein H0X14_00070 [Acidobacteria bacterium]|nr:hypothetical protein [Acidobacteriota bacterium]
MSAREQEVRFKVKMDASQSVGEASRLRGALKREFDGITGDIAGAAGGAGRFAASLGPVGLALGVTAGAATLVTAGLGAMIVRGVELGSRLNDISLQTGLTVETLSGLESQLKQSGTSLEAVSNAVFFLHKNLGEAQGGSKELKAAFADMGVRDLDAALSDTDTTFRQIVKSLGEMTDAGERDAAGSKVLGRAYKELRVFIADTGGDIDEVMRLAREAGLVMSGEVAGNLDALGDAWDRLDYKTQVMGANFAGIVAPEITKALDDISSALGSNLGNWETWATGAAMSMARVRGGMEGAAKWWNGNTWSPWDLGKQIEHGADAAEIGMMTDMLYNKYKAQTPTKPSGGGGIARGGGGGKGKSKKADDSKLKGLESDDRDTDTDFRRESDALARDYKNRLDTLEEYTSSELALLYVWITEKRRIFDEEEAEVNRSVKNEKDREQKLRDIQTKRVAASDEFDRKRNATEDNLADEQRKAAQAKAEGLAKIEDTSAKRRIASIEASTDLGIKHESDAAKEIGDIQLEMHDRAVGLLKSRLEQEQKGSAEYERIQKDIGAMEVERAIISEATAHRVVMAKKAERDAAEGLRNQLRDINLELRQMGIDAWERENRFPTRGEKRGVISSRAEAERDSENGRHDDRMKYLDELRKEGKEEKTIHELEEAEGRRHNLEMGRINDEEKARTRGLDPLGPLKDLWGDFKSGAKDSSDSIAGSVQTMSTTVVGALGNMGGALKEGIKANILYGDSIGLSIKKALAEQLAGVSAEAMVQGLKHAAWALGSLAFGNFGGAAKHAAASAAFFGLAAATGYGAGKLAKSAGMSREGTGASAGTAIANQPRNEKFNYNEGNESASDAQRDGSRGGFWERLERTHQQWLDLARQQTTAQAYTVQAIRENTAALAPFKTASPEDVVMKGVDTHNGVRAIGEAVLRHSGTDDNFNNNLAWNMRVA